MVNKLTGEQKEHQGLLMKQPPFLQSTISKDETTIHHLLKTLC